MSVLQPVLGQHPSHITANDYSLIVANLTGRTPASNMIRSPTDGHTDSLVPGASDSSPEGGGATGFLPDDQSDGASDSAHRGGAGDDSPPRPSPTAVDVASYSLPFPTNKQRVYHHHQHPPRVPAMGHPWGRPANTAAAASQPDYFATDSGLWLPSRRRAPRPELELINAAAFDCDYPPVVATVNGTNSSSLTSSSGYQSHSRQSSADSHAVCAAGHKHAAANR